MRNRKLFSKHIVMENKLVRHTGGGTLVDPRQILQQATAKKHKVLYITISPSPSAIHKIDREFQCRSQRAKLKAVRTTYGFMTHKEQAAYLHNYFDTVYAVLMDPEDKCVIVHELNESNNLHYHVLMYCPAIQSEYDLKALQKTVYCHPYTSHNLSKGNKIDFMNNIVYAKDPLKTYDEYFTKQESTGIKKHYPDLLYNM